VPGGICPYPQLAATVSLVPFTGVALDNLSVNADKHKEEQEVIAEKLTGNANPVAAESQCPTINSVDNTVGTMVLQPVHNFFHVNHFYPGMVLQTAVYITHSSSDIANPPALLYQTPCGPNERQPHPFCPVQSNP